MSSAAVPRKTANRQQRRGGPFGRRAPLGRRLRARVDDILYHAAAGPPHLLWQSVSPSQHPHHRSLRSVLSVELSPQECSTSCGGCHGLDTALKRVVVSVVSLELSQLNLLSSSYDGRAWGMPRRSAVAAWEDNMVPPCGAGTYSHCRYQRARRHRMRVVRGHHARARA